MSENAVMCGQRAAALRLIAAGLIFHGPSASAGQEPCVDLRCRTASGIETSMSSENGTGKAALQRKVDTAFALIVGKTSVERGVALLKEAADEGSDEAKYRLGWLYMHDVVSKDYDKALEYLKQAGGDFR